MIQQLIHTYLIKAYYISVCRHTRDACQGSRSLYARVSELQDCLQAGCTPHPASMVRQEKFLSKQSQNHMKLTIGTSKLANLKNETLLPVKFHVRPGRWP